MRRSLAGLCRRNRLEAHDAVLFDRHVAEDQTGDAGVNDLEEDADRVVRCVALAGVLGGVGPRVRVRDELLGGGVPVELDAGGAGVEVAVAADGIAGVRTGGLRLVDPQLLDVSHVEGGALFGDLVGGVLGERADPRLCRRHAGAGSHGGRDGEPVLEQHPELDDAEEQEDEERGEDRRLDRHSSLLTARTPRAGAREQPQGRGAIEHGTKGKSESASNRWSERKYGRTDDAPGSARRLSGPFRLFELLVRARSVGAGGDTVGVMSYGPGGAAWTRARVAELDGVDPLAGFRSRFVIDDDALVYLDGNSLGRLSKAARDRVVEAVENEWGRRLILSWDEQWLELPTRLGDLLGVSLLGAGPGEVVVNDSTTVSLYKAVSAALDARPGRTAILIEEDGLPTDRYVAEWLAADVLVEVDYVADVAERLRDVLVVAP